MRYCFCFWLILNSLGVHSVPFVAHTLPFVLSPLFIHTDATRHRQSPLPPTARPSGCRSKNVPGLLPFCAFFLIQPTIGPQLFPELLAMPYGKEYF